MDLTEAISPCGSGWAAARIASADGLAPIVLVCEHASRKIPAEFDDLGLDAAALRSHAAWDIGAEAVARRMSARLGAPLVCGAISRLVYDCNRPLSSPDCISEHSEIFDIPGNRDLSGAQRRARHDRIHDPFHATVADICARQTTRTGSMVTLVTIHSFTPVYLGVRREVEIGFLHHGDKALAEAAFVAETARGVFRTALDEPYSAADGVTYTLARHGYGMGRPSVMIEIRNDLITTDDAAARMSDHLCETLSRALGAGAGSRDAAE